MVLQVSTRQGYAQYCSLFSTRCMPAIVSAMDAARAAMLRLDNEVKLASDLKERDV